MSLLKTGACFTAELELNCPTIVACVAALPVGPAAAAGDLVLGPDSLYHALPAAPASAAPALAIAGNQLTIAGGNTVTLPDLDTQDLSIVGNVISLTNGGSVTLPASVVPAPQVLSIAGSNVSLSGGGGTIALPAAAAQDPYATPAQTITGAATALIVNPADLYARENIAAQTGLNSDTALIPAPGASQSPWGTNTLGEVLHYAPGLGWQIVNKYLHIEQNVAAAAAIPIGVNVVTNVTAYTAPRAGLVTVTANVTTDSADYANMSGGISVGGVLKRFDNTDHIGPAFTPVGGGFYLTNSNNSATAWSGRVAAGTVIAAWAICGGSSNTAYGNLTVTYMGE